MLSDLRFALTIAEAQSELDVIAAALDMLMYP